MLTSFYANPSRTPAECLLHLKDEMRFTDNENTVSLSESFARCAIGRDRYLEPFLRFQLFLLASCSSLQLSSLGSDLHQPRDIIMETDMIYLNGTRGTECRWRREPVKGGTPSTSTRESRVVKPPILQLRLVLPPYQTETLTCLTAWRWAG